MPDTFLQSDLEWVHMSGGIGLTTLAYLGSGFASASPLKYCPPLEQSCFCCRRTVAAKNHLQISREGGETLLAKSSQVLRTFLFSSSPYFLLSFCCFSFSSSLYPPLSLCEGVGGESFNKRRPLFLGATACLQLWMKLSGVFGPAPVISPTPLLFKQEEKREREGGGGGGMCYLSIGQRGSQFSGHKQRCELVIWLLISTLNSLPVMHCAHQQ